MRTRGDAGTTLIELLMAVSIMGIAFVAILAAMGTSIFTSDVHRKQATANTVLVSSVEWIKSQSSNPYSTVCPTSYSATDVSKLPAGWSAGDVTITSISYWDGTSFVATCPATDKKLQMLTVQVTTPDGRATESVSLVKRNPV